MDSFSVPDDNSELDSHASSDRLTRSNTDIDCSTPGADSIDYSRTISSASSYSELTDDNGSTFDPPVSSPISKLVRRASPSVKKLGMKKNVDMLDWKAGSEEKAFSGNSIAKKNNNSI